VVAAAVVVATGAAGPASASLLASWTGASGTPIGTSTPWAVTVGRSSRTLFPGVAANIPYTVENRAPGKQSLNGARVELRNDGVGIYDNNTNSYVEDCLASWFHVGTDTPPVPAGGAAVDPGASVSGSVDVVFEDAPVPQDACHAVALDVDVTAE
jgi:hypothetical protein